MAKKQRRADRRVDLLRERARRDKKLGSAVRSPESSPPNAAKSKRQGKVSPTAAENDFALFSLLQAANMEVTPDTLLNGHPKVGQILGVSDRVETAAVYGAMLLDPRLQSNCTRLEALVHLALVAGEGNKLVTQPQLAECFKELDTGIAGHMEDPAEDVFVSLVTTSEGDFRVLEGIWESGTFYLQRIIEIVESMPDEGNLAQLRRAVFGLLRLSEAVCERAGLVRYSVGEIAPKSKIRPAFCSKANRTLLFFDCDQLAELGVTKEDLDAFILVDQLLPQVRREAIASSPLQHYPILDARNRIVLVLPSAVSFAIRTAVVNFVIAFEYDAAFRKVLAADYSELFQSVQLLGSLNGSPVQFLDDGDLSIAEFIATVDSGRYLQPSAPIVLAQTWPFRGFECTPRRTKYDQTAGDRRRSRLRYLEQVRSGARYIAICSVAKSGQSPATQLERPHPLGERRCLGRRFLVRRHECLRARNRDTSLLGKRASVAHRHLERSPTQSESV